MLDGLGRAAVRKEEQVRSVLFLQGSVLTNLNNRAICVWHLLQEKCLVIQPIIIPGAAK